jgi:hypothetical protein
MSITSYAPDVNKVSKSPKRTDFSGGKAVNNSVKNNGNCQTPAESVY